MGALFAIFVALSGCGGGGRRHGDEMMDGATGMTATTPPSGGAAASGRALFLASGCGGCHTLAAAGATGTAGPDLDQARPSDAEVVQRLTEGSSGMPSFASSLTAAQMRSIARYVVGSTR